MTGTITMTNLLAGELEPVWERAFCSVSVGMESSVPKRQCPVCTSMLSISALRIFLFEQPRPIAICTHNMVENIDPLFSF